MYDSGVLMILAILQRVSISNSIRFIWKEKTIELMSSRQTSTVYYQDSEDNKALLSQINAGYTSE